MKNWFSLDEVVGESWEVFKKSPLKIIGVLFLLFIASILSSFLFQFLTENLDPILGFSIQQIISWIVSAITDIILIVYTLNLFRDKKVSILSKLKDYKVILSSVVFTFLAILIFLGGLVLLIIPAIYFSVRIYLAPYFIVDKGVGPIEGIKRSWRATKGHFFSMFGAAVVFMLLNIVGLLALVVGLLVTIPLGYIASAYIYKKLSN